MERAFTFRQISLASLVVIIFDARQFTTTHKCLVSTQSRSPTWISRSLISWPLTSVLSSIANWFHDRRVSPSPKRSPLFWPLTSVLSSCRYADLFEIVNFWTLTSVLFCFSRSGTDPRGGAPTRFLDPVRIRVAARQLISRSLSCSIANLLILTSVLLYS